MPHNRVLMWLQTARHLLKSCEAARGGKPVHGSAAYLMGSHKEKSQKCTVSSATDWRDTDVLVTALRYVGEVPA